MKTKMMIVVILAALLFASITYQNYKPNLQGKPECIIDSDCVPDSCCHAKSCVSYKDKPDCENVICTMNCEPGTLDCGGNCMCINNKCTAIIENGE